MANFFFQAEGGIRDYDVTGVQTCALPILLGAATLMGFLSEKGYSQSYFKCFITLILGSIVIFAFGVGYLGSIIGYDKALSAGLMPFVPSEFFKIALALVLIPSFTKFLNK